MKLPKTIIVLIGLCAFAGVCQSEQLGTASIDGIITGFNFPDPPTQEIYINWIGLRPPNPFPDETVCSFMDVRMTLQNYDTTLIILPPSHCIDFLKDNVSNYIGAEVHFVGPGSRHSAQSILQQEQVAFGLAVPDFHGASITSVSLAILDLRFVERPDRPYSHDVHITVQMIVEGSWANPVESMSWGRIKIQYEGD